MKVRLITLAMPIICIVFAIPAVASAHVLKVDGSIGAVLHINPDDNPTTGNSTDYVLSFSDDSGKFNLTNCNCTIAVMQNSQPVASEQLSTSKNNVSENHYTFAKPGVYTLRVAGTPKTPGAFQPFILAYEVRVTSGQTNAQPMPAALWVGMGMATALILLAAYASEYSTAKPTTRSSK
jgi:hypothetical protein